MLQKIINNFIIHYYKIFYKFYNGLLYLKKDKNKFTNMQIVCDVDM